MRLFAQIAGLQRLGAANAAGAVSHAARGKALAGFERRDKRWGEEPVAGRDEGLSAPRASWAFSRIAMGTLAPAIQPKLILGEPGDAREREADSVAAQVMQMPVPAGVPVAEATRPARIQRRCACGGSCPKCKAGEQETHDDQQAQRKPLVTPWASPPAADPNVAPQAVGDVLRMPGHPLDPPTRRSMESRFGRDFSQVRIHTGADAASSAKAIHAQAYASGPHIVFGAGRYRPETREGGLLIAHELTHVLQQSSGMAAIQRYPDDRWKNDVQAAKHQAQLMADRIRKHGAISKEVRAKMNSDLEYFDGAARDAYIGVITPAARPYVEVDMESTVEAENAANAKAAAGRKSEADAQAARDARKTCSRLPDQHGGKKCHFYVYDDTLEGALGVAWKRLAIGDAKLRSATWALPGGKTMEETLFNILSLYAEKDCDCTDEIQFWSHGSAGNGAYISNSERDKTLPVGQSSHSELEAADFDIPGLDKFGDDSSQPGYREWHDGLSVYQRRLVLLRRTICDSDSTVYYRSCQAFKGEKGKEFAEASSIFWRCDVSGHTKSIGLSQPGEHTLSVCEKPDWSNEEGADEEGKKDSVMKDPNKHDKREIKPQ
jgi:hypothetical protein